MGKTKVLGCKVSDTVYDEFQREAKAHKQTVSEYLNQIIETRHVNSTLTKKDG
jgi:hypothetical protein